MPYCLNNPKRTYKGNEPSPKGCGYCASGENEGKKMKGKDGNMLVKKGGKLIKDKVELNCKKLIRYEKVRILRSGAKIIEKGINGIPAEEGYIYKWIGYNQFEDTPTKIPKGYKKRTLSKKWIEQFGCGDRKRVEEITWNKSIHQGYQTYFTHDNGGRPFLVSIKGKTVKIYRSDPKIYQYSDKVHKYHYDYLIKEYHTKKIFIGKSPKNEMTDFSGGYGKYFNGNSILLELPDGKCVFIGESIYQFTPTSNIVSYCSPVGNNDVPYPFALDNENIYFMLDAKYVPVKYLPKLNKTQMTDLYSYYYGHSGPEPLEKYAKKMKGVKVIQKRLS